MLNVDLNIGFLMSNSIYGQMETSKIAELNVFWGLFFVCLFFNRIMGLSPCIWDTYNNYSSSVIAFSKASRGRIWTQIGGNESQRLPGPHYPPQSCRFGPEKLNIDQHKIEIKTVKHMMLPYYYLILADKNPMMRLKKTHVTTMIQNMFSSRNVDLSSCLSIYIYVCRKRKSLAWGIRCSGRNLPFSASRRSKLGFARLYILYLNSLFFFFYFF